MKFTDYLINAANVAWRLALLATLGGGVAGLRFGSWTATVVGFTATFIVLVLLVAILIVAVRREQAREAADQRECGTEAGA